MDGWLLVSEIQHDQYMCEAFLKTRKKIKCTCMIGN